MRINSVLSWFGRVGAPAAFGLLALMVLGAPDASAAVTACPAIITSCGCVITKPGFYDIDSDLSSAQGTTKSGDCIDIRAKNVQLDGDGHDIAGAGTGVGIRVLKGAKFATLADFDTFGWNIGVEDDASNSVITLFNSEANASAALLLKGSNNNLIQPLIGSLDDTVSGPCVILKNSNRNSLSITDMDDCTDGVDLIHSSNNVLAVLSVGPNSGDGIFLDPGSNNNLLNFNLVGENVKNGIEIGKGSKRNKVVTNEVGPDGGFDLLDDNSKCDNNTWFDNLFDTSSPAPVSVSAVCID